MSRGCRCEETQVRMKMYMFVIQGHPCTELQLEVTKAMLTRLDYSLVCFAKTSDLPHRQSIFHLMSLLDP
jgi:hypothetical protein